MNRTSRQFEQWCARSGMKGQLLDHFSFHCRLFIYPSSPSSPFSSLQSSLHFLFSLWQLLSAANLLQLVFIISSSTPVLRSSLS